MELEKSNLINMNKSDLKKLSKSKLIKLILKPEIIVVDDTKPMPLPRKGVNQMVQDYENNIIPPPLEFRDKPVPAPRTEKPIPAPRTKKPMPAPRTEKPVPAPRTKKPMPAPRTEKPVPAPRTKIEQTNKALKGYTKSYEINIKSNKDPLVQLQTTRKAIAYHIMNILKSMKGLKFVETLKVTFKKIVGDEMVYKPAYFNTTAETIINNLEITESLEVSKQNILNKIAVWISEGSGWTIQSADTHYLNVVKYQPMRGSSYIQLPKELRGLINIKNKDNECFRWCHIRHLNPQNKDPQRIKTSDKEYINKLDYSGIEFPITIKQFNKIERQNKIKSNVFGYDDKQPYPIYISKEKFENHMELLLITNDENKHYVFIKDFNNFMYKQTKHKERKHFCMCCLQCFSSERV